MKTKIVEIVGLEALIIWNHPELGMISPLEFIPIAKQTNLIISIREWVLRTACKQNKMWQEEGLPRIRMGVNLSAKQFQHGNLVRAVEEILSETDLECQYLELEITESAVMKGKSTIENIYKGFNSIKFVNSLGTQRSAYPSEHQQTVIEFFAIK